MVDDAYIYPEANLAIGNHDFKKAYDIIVSIDVIGYMQAHGDFGKVNESTKESLIKMMGVTKSVLQSNYDKMLKESIANHSTYLRKKNNVR